MSNDKMREARNNLVRIEKYLSTQPAEYCGYMDNYFSAELSSIEAALSQQPDSTADAEIADLKRQLALAESHLEAYREVLGDGKQPESEPAWWEVSDWDSKKFCCKDREQALRLAEYYQNGNVIPLFYTSPQPSAQVPDKKELKDTPREYFQTDSELYVYTAGWNDCRDSMLAPSIVENKDG